MAEDERSDNRVKPFFGGKERSDISKKVNTESDAEERPEEQIQEPESDLVTKLIKIYESAIADKKIVSRPDLAKERVQNIFFDISPEQIYDFSQMLRRYRGHPNFNYTGGFLTHFINLSSQEEFRLDFGDFGTGIDYLGQELVNGKNILINGSVGNYLGNKMQGGEIIVEGDAVSSVGHEMKGGVIQIKGYVLGTIGRTNGGEIYVGRDVGSIEGDYWQPIKNTTISVSGNVRKITGVEGRIINVDGNIGFIERVRPEVEINAGGDIKKIGRNVLGKINGGIIKKGFKDRFFDFWDSFNW